VDGVRKLELVDDRRVGRGARIVESENGVMDARIKTQLDEVTRVVGEATTTAAGLSGTRALRRASSAARCSGVKKRRPTCSDMHGLESMPRLRPTIVKSAFFTAWPPDPSR
jgi:hypothetical protein